MFCLAGDPTTLTLTFFNKELNGRVLSVGKNFWGRAATSKPLGGLGTKEEYRAAISEIG